MESYQRWYYVPKKIVEGVATPEPEFEFNAADWKNVQVNAEALNMLHFALDSTEYNRVSGCDSRKEVWDNLESTYEATILKNPKLANSLENMNSFKWKKMELGMN